MIALFHSANYGNKNMSVDVTAGYYGGGIKLKNIYTKIAVAINNENGMTWIFGLCQQFR